MPAAIAIPLGLAAVSLVAGNAQNKAANKNNLNQQAGAVQNAKQAEATAAQQAAALVANNPGPFAGQSIAAPTGGYAGPGTGAGSSAAAVGSATPAAAMSTPAASAGAGAGSNTVATNPLAQAVLRQPGSVSPIARGPAMPLPGVSQNGTAAGTTPMNPTQNPIIRRILMSAGMTA